MMHILAGLNILLGLTGFIWVMARTVTRLHEYPPEVLHLLFGYMGFFFALLITSMDMYYRDFNSYTSLAITVVKVYALYILWRHPETLFRTGERTHTRTDSSNSDEEAF